MRKLEAVIFDLDGTLIDSMGIWQQVDIEFLQERGISVPKNLFEDLEGGNSFNEIAQYFKDKFNLTESVSEISLVWTKMVETHYKEDIAIKPGVKKVLQFLQSNNIKLAVGTSNSLFLAQAALQSNKISEYFSAFTTGEEEIKGKPFPDIFLKSAERLAVEPSNCVVIEDTLEGVRAAKNAQMYTIAIKDKYSEKNTSLIKNYANFYAENFHQILNHLKQLFF